MSPVGNSRVSNAEIRPASGKIAQFASINKKKYNENRIGKGKGNSENKGKKGEREDKNKSKGKNQGANAMFPEAENGSPGNTAISTDQSEVVDGCKERIPPIGKL